LLAGLNTDPAEGSAALVGAVLRETLFAGGRACRPLVAVGGLSECFVEPALARLSARGATIAYGRRLRGLAFADGRAVGLDFADGRRELASNDAVILAAPPFVARELIPDLDAPNEFRAIVNAHFRVAPAKDQPLILGVVNGFSQWIFSYPDHVSATISGADRLIDESRENLAETIWREVAALCGFDSTLPPWRIIKERRATFAATPVQNGKRPPARTSLANVVLAGDWTQTALPATIEGAVRSGYKAASVVTERHGRRPDGRKAGVLR